MSQNALRLSWPREAVDARLLQIRQGIPAACLKADTGLINTVIKSGLLLQATDPQAVQLWL
jgi:hypothetical protein